MSSIGMPCRNNFASYINAITVNACQNINTPNATIGSLASENVSAVNATVTGDLNVQGAVALSGNVELTNLNVTNDVQIGNNLTVAGDGTFENIAVKDTALVGNKIEKDFSENVAPGEIVGFDTITSSSSASTFTVNSAGNIDINTPAGFATNINGDINVFGTIFSTEVQQLLIQNNLLFLNNNYTNDAAVLKGFVAVNYAPTSVNDTISGDFTAGVAATSNPSVQTTGTGIFAAGDIVIITDAFKPENDSVYEVLSHVGNVLEVKGIGVVAPTNSFFKNQFETSDPGDTVQGAIRKINIAVIGIDDSGDWETFRGSSTSDASFVNKIKIIQSIASAGPSSGIVVDNSDPKNLLLSLDAPIAETSGGTGQTTYSTGDILYSDAANSLSKLPVGSSGNVLSVGGSSVPQWTNVSVSANGGGDVPLINASPQTGTSFIVKDLTAGTGVSFANGVNAITINNTGVTSVGTSGGITGGPITTTGTVSLANIGANSFLANNTGVSATPVSTSATDATALLNTFTTVLKGLAPASGGGTANFLRADGTWATPPDLQGVTSVGTSGGITGGPITTTGTVSLANIGANSFLANNTGALATPVSTSATDATALLNTFTSVLKGLAPASGGGTANYLRADGTWTAPPGTAGTATVGQLFFSNIAAPFVVVCAATLTYYPVAITSFLTTRGTGVYFTQPTNGTIQYTNAATRAFSASFSSSFFASRNDKFVLITLFKNGVATNISLKPNVKDNSRSSTSSFTTDVQLAQNDTLSVQIQVEDAATNVSFETFILYLRGDGI